MHRRRREESEEVRLRHEVVGRSSEIAISVARALFTKKAHVARWGEKTPAGSMGGGLLMDARRAFRPSGAPRIHGDDRSPGIPGSEGTSAWRGGWHSV